MSSLWNMTAEPNFSDKFEVVQQRREQAKLYFVNGLFVKLQVFSFTTNVFIMSLLPWKACRSAGKTNSRLILYKWAVIAGHPNGQLNENNNGTSKLGATITENNGLVNYSRSVQKTGNPVTRVFPSQQFSQCFGNAWMKVLWDVSHNSLPRRGPTQRRLEGSCLLCDILRETPRNYVWQWSLKRPLDTTGHTDRIVLLSMEGNTNTTVSTAPREVEVYLAQEIALAVNKYWLITMVVLGFPGNTVSFIIMLQKHNRHFTTCLFLAALAVSDNFSLLLGAHFWAATELVGKCSFTQEKSFENAILQISQEPLFS